MLIGKDSVWRDFSRMPLAGLPVADWVSMTRARSSSGTVHHGTDGAQSSVVTGPNSGAGGKSKVGPAAHRDGSKLSGGDQPPPHAAQ